MTPTHAEGKIHRGHENVHAHHDRHHPGHDRRQVKAKPGDAIDISYAQGSVDFAKVAPLDVIFKITEGATYQDPTATSARVKAIREAKIGREAVYHFCRPANNKPEAEVANVLRTAEKLGLEWVGDHWYDGRAKANGVRLFCDFETPPFDAAWLHGFGEEFHKRTGHLSDLYGYGASLNPVLSAFDAFGFVDFAAYVPDWHPYYQGPVQKVKYWQHSSNGRADGVSGAVDLDRYLG